MKTNHSTKLILAAVLAGSVAVTAERADAQIHVGIGVPLPSISFHVAPQLVALPGTYAYVVPDYESELFFYDGFWWRPYEGRWYRSAYYDRDWEVYGSVPIFYSSIPRDWRTRYHNRQWDGRPWNYERVGYDDVRQNWSSWKRERRWDSAVRDAGRDDRRYEKSSAGPDRRLQERSAPDTRIRERSAPAPDRRYQQKAAPTHRVERGPAHTSKPQQSRGSSNVRSSGGERGHGGGKQANQKGEKGHGKGGDHR